MILDATCNKLWNQLLVHGNLVLENLYPWIVSTLHFSLPTLNSARVVRAALVASTERPWSTLVNKKLVGLLKWYLVMLKSVITLNHSIMAWYSFVGPTQCLNFVLNHVIQSRLSSFLQCLVKYWHRNCWMEVNVFFSLRHFNCVSILGSWMLYYTCV